MSDTPRFVFSLAEAFALLAEQLGRIERKLDRILAAEESEMAEIDDLRAAVANEQTVEESAVTLLTGLTAQINTLTQNATDLATLKGQLGDLTTQVNADATNLAVAVAANTPAAPTPPA